MTDRARLGVQRSATREGHRDGHRGVGRVLSGEEAGVAGRSGVGGD